MNDDDLAWLAGLIDAEGCFGLRRHTKRPTQVLANGFVGMSDLLSVERAKQIAEALYGESLTMHRRKPESNPLSTADFFCFNMVAKKPLFVFLRQVLPYLCIKRVEAVLQYDFLARASQRRHVGTEHDFWLCEMSRRIKDGDEGAKTEALMRVRDDFTRCGSDLAWLAGYTDGDGSVSMAHGTKTILVTYCAMSRPELELAREKISVVLGGMKLPPLKEDESPLSSKKQWKLDLRETAIVEPLLTKLGPYLYTKRLQAELVLFVRATGSLDERETAISLIHDLNKGRSVHDRAHTLLKSHTGP